MSSIEKLSHFTDNFLTLISAKAEQAIQQFTSKIQTIQVQNEKDLEDLPHVLDTDPHFDIKKDNQKEEQRFEGLNELQLIQSRAVANLEKKDIPAKENELSRIASSRNKIKSDVDEGKSKKKRIKQIEEEKKRIADQLKMIDQEIEEIKGTNTSQNQFKKREKINRDQSAQKNAEMLVKELKNQKKQMQMRKRQQFEKSLVQLQKEDELRKRIREEQILKAKQERRLAIMQRMQQEKKRRQQRKLIEAQSNQLIVRLKKEQQLEKAVAIAPSQVVEIDSKKRALEKKNIFNLEQIQEHDRKYREQKLMKEKEKQERAHSLKANKQLQSIKYSKNMWIERIEQEQQRKKQQEKQAQERRRNQLEKRLKYGELVKNIFLPKKKEKNKENQKDDIHEIELQRNDEKPMTPQEVPTLPKVKTSKNKTQNSKMFKQQSLPGIKQMTRRHYSKEKAQPKIKQFDQAEILQVNQEQREREKQKKLRQQQIRRQTKDRLKKLESQSLNKGAQQERFKYKNYLGEVKIKKDEPNQWKKIINNDKLTEEQKYQQIMKKAQVLETKAKKKEVGLSGQATQKNSRNQTDEDAVNLYIGSIQAKLALLQKF